MPVYEILITKDQRHVVTKRSVDCQTDLEAITIAHSMLTSDQVADVWQGERKVCQLDATPAEPGSPAPNGRGSLPETPVPNG